MKPERKEKIKWLISIVLPFVVFYILTNYIFGIVIVSGSSMEPTYYQGDILLMIRTNKNIKRQNVVVIRYQDHYIIKRVIAFEGETIDFIDGAVYVDKQPVRPEANTTNRRDVIIPHKVEDNSIFVMGDNRNYSLDSRYKEIGDISQEQIIGIVIFTIKGDSQP